MSKQVAELHDVSVLVEGEVLLDSLSFSISEGEHYVVFGPNGCGKTTLMSLLSGIRWPSKGTFSLLGKPLGTVDVRELRTVIGRVSHTLQTRFHQSRLRAAEVVATGYFDSILLVGKSISREQEERVRCVLQQLGVIQFGDRNFSTLSYGEQRRVLLARALVHSPRLIVLDEPFDGLDVVAKKQFHGALAEMRRLYPKLATLWTTHSLEEIPPFSDKVIALKKGRPLFEGRLEDIASSECMSQLFDAPISVARIDGRYFLAAS